MTSMRDKYVSLLTRQIGYPENPLGSNKTKYGRWFDVEAWQYFNGKKNGQCGWCAELVIWGVAQNEILGKAESMKFQGGKISLFRTSCTEEQCSRRVSAVL